MEDARVAVYSGGVGVAAGEEGGAGGGADGVWGEAAVEGDSLAGEAVQVGGAAGGTAGVAERIVALLIGDEEEDVGTVRIWARHGRSLLPPCAPAAPVLGY